MLRFVATAILTACSLTAQIDSRQILDFLERTRDDKGLPGLAAAVSIDGKIVFSEGVGYAELDNRSPQTGRSVNNIGSVSKVVATVGLMKLVEQGKVDLDAEIQTYIPFYPTKKWPITLRHILTQTSGTRHYNGVEFGEHRSGALRHYDSFEEASKIWRDDPLLFEPGSAWSYSSHAFNLLQGVIESASGEDFESYLRQNVFEPAGMLATQFDVLSRVIGGRGHGYRRNDGGGFSHADREDPSFKFAGGGILSTVEDLVRFCDGLNRGMILKQTTIATMMKPQLDASIKTFGDNPRRLNFQQALGWRIATLRGHRYSTHGGSVKGVKTYLANFADAGLIIAVQGNEASFNPGPVALAIASMLLPPPR